MSIVLKNVQVNFRNSAGQDVPVLDIEDLTVEDGTELCIVGGSGSGKTTLLHLLAGIIVPSRGNVIYDETDIAKLAEAARDEFRARHIGYVFQTFNLLSALTSTENVALAGSLAGYSVKDARRRARELLDRVGLGHRMDARPATLSTGEKQRVALARALINQPQVVLADEPTANLDGKSSQEVLSLLKEMTDEQRSILVLVTHESQVRERFDRVIALDEGAS